MSSPGAAGKAARASRSSSRAAPRPRGQSFPRESRLRARRQFLLVYDRGRRASSESMTLFALPNDAGFCRLGITVTRRSGGAVVRNRLRRLLREAFRRNQQNFAPPLDLVVNVKPQARGRSYRQLEAEFLGLVMELARRFGR